MDDDEQEAEDAEQWAGQERGDAREEEDDMIWLGAPRWRRRRWTFSRLFKGMYQRSIHNTHT